MTKLIIFDGHAVMYRAFHAMPTLTTKKGEPINAVHGVISMLLNVVTNLEPTHICFCFDEKEKTFRNKLSKQYQAQRPPMPNELLSQFEKIKFFLKAANIKWCSKPGYEADDVIGTLSLLATSHLPQVDEVVVVTGDRDIMQIIDDQKNIKLFMPISGLSAGKIFSRAETIERIGVAPFLIPDYKGLVGDPSDNYFGVPGVGPKTAIDLLTEYKSFNGVYENINKVSEKLREKLIKGEKSARLSYKLAMIVKDVPIKVEIKQMNKWRLDSKEVLDLFENEFGFKTLTSRIKKLGEKIEQEKQGSLF